MSGAMMAAIGLAGDILAAVPQWVQQIKDLTSAIPLRAAQVVFIGLYVILGIWVLTLGRGEGQRDPTRPRLLGDLRLWAWVVIGIQVYIYWELSL